METLLYDNFRQSIFKFWVSYINTISLPSDLDLKITPPLIEETRSFLELIIQLHLNTPWYRHLQLSPYHIQSEQLCFSIQNNTVKQVTVNHSNDDVFTLKSAQFLEKHYQSLEKTPDTFTPIQKLIHLTDKKVLGLIGFYTYNPIQNTYWIFLYNLSNNKEYSLEEKTKYCANPNIDTFKEKYGKIPIDQPTIPLKSFAESINMFPYILTNKLKEYGNCTLNQYHRYNRMLESLHLLLFSTNCKNKTEVAQAVGYKSLSSYSKAFNNHFLIELKSLKLYK